MRRILLVGLLAIASAAWSTELWDQAVILYEQNQELLPGRMIIRFDQFNGRGDLVSSETSDVLLYLDESGEMQSTIVSATKNGRDVTESRRENPSSGSPFGSRGGGGNESDDDNAFAGLQRSPFDPLEQSHVLVVDTGRTEYVGTTAARVHEFELRTGEKSRTTGVAWLSVSDGTPLRVEATVAPLPIFVQIFEFVQEFSTDEAGRWFMSSMEFNAEGSFLFIRRRIESVFEFSDYFAP